VCVPLHPDVSIYINIYIGYNIMALALIKNTASQIRGSLLVYTDDKGFSSYVFATAVITSN
jgi:hypothetical protein